jgi:hypothetical protein
MTKDIDLSRDCRLVWEAASPLKVKIFAWLLKRGRILTKVWRAQWAQGADMTYTLCLGVEDVEHFFSHALW